MVNFRNKILIRNFWIS